MTAQTVALLPGTNDINGVLSGVRWAGTVMTYGFPSAGSQYSGYPWNLSYDHDNNPATPNIIVSVNETTGFRALNANQQAAVQAAFLSFRELTNMSALEQQPADGADVRLAMSTTRDPTNTTAYARYPGDGGRDGDVWLNTTDYNTPRLGTYAYQTFFMRLAIAWDSNTAMRPITAIVMLFQPRWTPLSLPP